MFHLYVASVGKHFHPSTHVQTLNCSHSQHTHTHTYTHTDSAVATAAAAGAAAPEQPHLPHPMCEHLEWCLPPIAALIQALNGLAAADAAGALGPLQVRKRG